MKKLSITIFCFLISGCVSTNITTFKDPAYSDYVIKKLLVWVADEDFTIRIKLERKIVTLLTEQGITAIESYLLFPPTRETTDDVIVDSVMSNDIGAYLLAGIKTAGVELVELPTTTTIKTKGKVESDGRFKSTTTVEESGGALIEKPWANFYARIIDAENGNTVWLSNAGSGGSAFTSFSDIYDSYCSEMVLSLIQDGLIGSKTYDIVILKNGERIVGTIQFKKQIKKESNISVKLVNWEFVYIKNEDIKEIIFAKD